MKMILKLYWLVLTTEWRGIGYSEATEAAAAAECPTSCRCYQQPAIIFNFSGNDVAELSNNALSDSHFRRLEILDLKNNGIRRVQPRAFENLKNLLEVDLSNNNISQMRGKLFESNRFLNTIRISGNPIKELGNGALPVSVYLKRLDFQGCKLNRIHRYAFLNTPLLESLNLKDNALKTPPMATLRLSQLRSLELDGNPWKCGEKLWRVLKWLQKQRGRHGSSGTVSATAESLPCVAGETNNAVFWDTMEADNFDKFQNSPTPRDRRASPAAAAATMSIVRPSTYPREYRPAELYAPPLPLRGVDNSYKFTEKQYRDDDDVDVDVDVDGSNFFEEHHRIVLCAEIALIVILLVILYKLWKDGNDRRYRGDLQTTIISRTAANNSTPDEKRVRAKNNDTQSSAYKRYSLSDEECSCATDAGAGNGEHAGDEGKYDTESGYLSYHRYNSIEGENTGNTVCNRDQTYAAVSTANENATSTYTHYRQNADSENGQQYLQNASINATSARLNNGHYSQPQCTRTRTRTRTRTNHNADDDHDYDNDGNGDGYVSARSVTTITRRNS